MSIALEALGRVISPPEISSPKIIVIVGSLGLLSNIVGLFLFHGTWYSIDEADKANVQNMVTLTDILMEEELSSCPTTRPLPRPMARLPFDDDPTRCLLYTNTPLRPGHKSSRPRKSLDTVKAGILSISDNLLLRPVLKPGVMADRNLVDLEMDLISSHTLKSTLRLDLALPL